MKKSYLLLGCAMGIGFAAQAALPEVFAMRGNYVLDQETPKAKVDVRSFTGVGDDKGVEIFGSTFMDGTGVPSSVKLNTNNLREINRLNAVKEDDDYRLWRIAAGEKAGDGTYYCHFIKVYSLVDTYGGWGTVNMKSGKVSIDRREADYNGGYDVYYNYNQTYGSQYPWAYLLRDMAWNAADNKMYAIAPSSDVNDLNTLLGTVDLTTGRFTPKAELDGLFYGLTCDLDGNFYGALCDGTGSDYVEPEIKGIQIVKIDAKNLVDEGGEYPTAYHEKVVDLKYENGLFRSYGGYGTLVKDDTTGELYFFINRLTDDNQITTTAVAHRINLFDKTSECLGSIGWTNDMFTGGVIEMRESAADRQAPAQVKNLKAAYAADGASNVTLTWNNPVSTWNLNDLTSLKEMRIAVDTPSNVKATVPASLDTESYTYTLTGVEKGVHNFYVIAVDGADRAGVPTPAEIWAGHDVPGLPLDVTLANDLDSPTSLAHITWSAPVEGMNGGWFDADNMKYNIVRMPDNVVVATNVEGLKYDDASIGEMASYYYLVSAVTADGEGPAAESNHMLIGNALATPYDVVIETLQEAEMWSVFDGQSGYFYDSSMFFENWIGSSLVCPWRGIKIDYSGGNMDRYACSPKIYMEGGKTYYVEMNVNYHFKVDSQHPNAYHDFELCIGKEKTAESMQKNVFVKEERYTGKYEDQVRVLSGYVKCPETGAYHVAYHDCTENGCQQDIVSIQTFHVEECYGVDLKPVSVKGTPAPAVGKESVYEVEVLNNGDQRARNYTVKIVRAYADMMIELGSATISTFLPSHEQRTVLVKVIPDIPGEYEIFAEVEVANDGNVDNNLSEPFLIEARGAGYEPLNEHLVIGELEYETNYPFAFMDPNGASQAILLMGDDLKWTPVENENGEKVSPKITDIAYEFEINAEYGQNFRGVTDMPVRVYLSQTTSKQYRGSTTRVIPVQDQTKVFDGKVSFKAGTGLLVLHFDEPFEVDLTKNLVVTVVKGDGGSISHEWALIWKLNNIGEEQPKRAAAYYGKTGVEFDSNPNSLPTGGRAFVLTPKIPRTYFAVTGIEGRDGVGNIIESVVEEDGTVNISDIINPVVYVYDLAGRLVNSFVPTGDKFDLGVEPGVYVVSIAGDNKTLSTKVKVGL